MKTLQQRALGFYRSWRTPTEMWIAGYQGGRCGRIRHEDIAQIVQGGASPSPVATLTG